MHNIHGIEKLRKSRIIQTSKKHKKEFGQYITPLSIAQFMVDIIPINYLKNYRILDPGAGIGTLSYTLLNKIVKDNTNSKIEVDCYEIDNSIINYLHDTFNNFNNNDKIKINYLNTDFILEASFRIGFNNYCDYTHIIMNPPYKKIKSNSDIRKSLNSIGIKTVNLYSAFLWLSILLLSENGYISAIIPRSFCNGVYYQPFREFLLKDVKIKRIHLFNSRKSTFKDESVLQENIIILLQKSSLESDIIISKSEDDTFQDYKEYKCSYEEIINPDDKQSFINIPEMDSNTKKSLFNNTISDLGLSVSTGPVVDFRVKEFLENEYKFNCVPLIYPVHLKNTKINWPVLSKKPNAIRIENNDIIKLLIPKGNYILIKRFSSKEEKRRIVASLILENDFINDYIAVENHLNIIHKNKQGLDKDLAYGLLTYFNSKYFDNEFRKFSGHTQVNSSDLRNMKYPSIDKLKQIGKNIIDNSLNNEELENIF